MISILWTTSNKENVENRW